MKITDYKLEVFDKESDSSIKMSYHGNENIFFEYRQIIPEEEVIKVLKIQRALLENFLKVINES